MLGPDPRTTLLWALLLDWLGQLLILTLILLIPVVFNLPMGGTQLAGQYPWILFCLLLYPLLGWLFGSYTVLRWRRLPMLVLVQRLLLAAGATLAAVAIARWLFNPGEEVWLVYRRVQLVARCAAVAVAGRRRGAGSGAAGLATGFPARTLATDPARSAEG
jgi:hypothetical protein